MRKDESGSKEYWLLQMTKKDDEIKAAKHGLTMIAERRKVGIRCRSTHTPRFAALPRRTRRHRARPLSRCAVVLALREG